MNEEAQIDKLDRRILQTLIADARTPYLEIARSCNVSGATIHLRIQKLEKLGILKGSHLVIDPSKLGIGICAFLGIYLDRASSYESVIEKLKSIDEIVECHYTTGIYSVFAKVFFIQYPDFADTNKYLPLRNKEA